MCKYSLIKKNVEDIVQKLLKDTQKYHPILLKYFTHKELEYLFKNSRNIADYPDDIHAIIDFCLRENYIGRRKIKKVCEVLFSTYHEGFYDCKYNIEFYLDIKNKKVIIEYYGEDLDLHRILTKEELLELYGFSPKME